ncbi:MAG: ATP synthase subunit I [Pseudomonadota bacterium]|nr:ATP synthase subunit I [Pseudomonadota bacterium]
MQQPDALGVKRVLAVQLAMTLILSAAALPFGASVALSVLIGAIVCLVANAVFALWVFRNYRAQQPGALLMRFYGAEIAKLMLILGLFAVAFTTIEGLNLPALLAAYFAVQVLPAIVASSAGARSTRER